MSTFPVLSCRRAGHRLARIVLLFSVLGLVLPGGASAETDDRAAIRSVIERAYVRGVWIDRDPDLVRAGFAPTFVMQVYWQGELDSRTLDQWLERMQLDR
ncbi:MAG: nuclear transport factor 2 family protein, partial [Holophagales bacterium]|nr:nuclear transport factor 2 family protein [Holophagales bacterium]